MDCTKLDVNFLVRSLEGCVEVRTCGFPPDHQNNLWSEKHRAICDFQSARCLCMQYCMHKQLMIMGYRYIQEMWQLTGNLTSLLILSV
jgi:hypothetical protein